MRVACALLSRLGVELVLLPVMALVLVSMSGCGQDVPWQAEAAEDVRELELLDRVDVVSLTREEFAAQAEAAAAARDDSELQRYADTYGRLGFFDMNLDLRPVVAGSSSDWVGATYSPSHNLVTLVGDARDDVIVHEFVHALQDQHFNLIFYDDYETSDGFLARRAAVEGDAVLAQYRFLGDGTLDDLEWQRQFDWWRDYSSETLTTAEYPVLFLDYVSFVYTYGFEYSAANLTGASFENPSGYRPGPHDWELQDQLFTERPPTSTQRVLDLDGARSPDGPGGDPVVRVGLESGARLLDGQAGVLRLGHPG